jgi:hypothetical protein
MTWNSIVSGGLIGTAWVLAQAARADNVATRPAANPSDTQVATTQPAPAQSGAENAATTQPTVRRSLLDIEELSLELGFEAAYDQRKVEFDTAEPFRLGYRQTNRARRLEETLGLRSTGSIVDERIALYDAAVRAGLTQEWFRETLPGPNRSESPDGTLFDYDLSFTFLPRGALSANAYAQRADSRVPRAFQPSLDRTLERYGGGLFLNDVRFPMRFTFEHSWDELTSRTGNLLDDEQRGCDTFQYEGTWQIDSRHSLRLEYEYDDRREQYSGTDTRFDTTRNYLTLNHVLRFGEDARSSWETLARFQNETGDLARDNAELSTRLRLQHTDALATNYAAQFLRDAFGELTTRSWRGEGGLTYQFEDSLTAAFQLYGLRQDAEESADFLEWGGLASAAFARDNALGQFSANLSYNHAATETRHGEQRGIVIAESVTLRDPLPAYLVHTDVDLFSVVVTDDRRTRTYLPGRDYFASRVGRYTALYRVPTGQIADRQTVLVSYTYRVFDDYDVTRDRLDVRIQQTFKFGLTPYYAASLQHEDLDHRRFLSFRARDVNRHRVGATYRKPRWSAGCEYESNDDAIDPYQALHLNGDVVLWQSARNQLDGKTTFSRFWFDGSDGLAARNATLLDLGVSYRHLLARNFEANAAALYRFESDSLFGDTHGVDLSAAVECTIGYFRLRFEAEYDLLDLPGSRDGDLGLWLKLKREIPLIARGTR